MMENDFRGKGSPGMRGFPGGRGGFERPGCFPGRPGNSETDGTKFQHPTQPTNEG